jgi:hypothetical protein
VNYCIIILAMMLKFTIIAPTSAPLLPKPFANQILFPCNK